MATNKLLKSLNTSLGKTPTHLECVEAFAALKKYSDLRWQIEWVFDIYNNERRVQQVNQYFQIRTLLETFKITFPNSSRITQAVDTKQFNLEWEGDRTARLFWSVGGGWSIEHKDFKKELSGVWEGFNLQEELEANQIDFDEYEDD